MSGWGFLNPALLAGLALGVIPILIHIFDRRRLRRQPLPTLRFLAKIEKQVKRRLKLRDLLLLASRVLAILLLALLFAHPFRATTETAAHSAGTSLRSLVFVIDASFGMRYLLDDEQLFETAKEKIAEETRRMRPGEEAALLACDRSLVHVTEGFQAGDVVRRGLRLLEAGEGLSPWQQCLRGALALAAEARNPAAEIRVFSNLAARAWEDNPIPPASDQREIRLVLIDVAETDLPNRAVTGLSLERAYGASGERWIARIQAANYGAPVDGVGVRMLVKDGSPLAEGFFDWEEPGLRERSLNLSPTAGEYVSGFVSLDGDALADDDKLPFQLYLGKPLRVLVIDGTPATYAEDSESYFAVTALRPGRVESAIEPRVITHADLTPADLADVDVAVLLNVGQLRREGVQLLDDFVRRGGGLLWASGDNTTAAVYERMGNLLPGKPRTVRDLRGPGHEPAKLRSFPRRHPIFEDLHLANLGTARFHAYQQLEGLPGNAQVLLELDDGSPALVETQVGEGRVLWFASSLSPAWSNLPYRPFFLPLMQQTVRYLGGALRPPLQHSHPLGAPVNLTETLRQRAAVVETPDGTNVAIEGPALNEPFTQTGIAGLYRVSLRDGTPLPDANFIVVRDPAASDLRRMAPEQLEAAIAAAGYGGGVESAEARAESSFDGLPLLLGLLALVLWSEAGLARRLR